jgi:iron-sulfur cluster assembly accessory protein
MVTISDTAVDKAREILKAEGKSEWGFRFYTAGSSCCGPSYGIDIVEEAVDGDSVVEKNGVKVFIEKEASEKLNGMEINYVDDGERQGFVLTGNEPSSCGPGCGSSCG